MLKKLKCVKCNEILVYKQDKEYISHETFLKEYGELWQCVGCKEKYIFTKKERLT